MEQIGPYRLGVRLGRGTTGEVWRADRPGPIPQVVAIKRAPGSAGAVGALRLRREAAVLAALDHPHVVRVLDVLEGGDEVAIVMPLARGGSLHDLLAERGRLAPGATVAVLSRVADALASAHRNGILHGDVKPANILFTADGEPLLGDFGVAQHLHPDRPAGAVEGTAGYVDPARVAGGRPEPRNDVYGLCVVGYLCLTGGLPHAGDGVEAILAAAATGEHPSLLDDPAVPVGLALTIEAGLARDPAGRPATAEQLAADLRAAVPGTDQVLPGTPLVPGGAGGPPTGPRAPVAPPDPAPATSSRAPAAPATRRFGPLPPSPAPPRPGRRRALVSVAAVAIVVAGALALGLGLRARPVAGPVPGAAEADGAPVDRRACPVLDPLPVARGDQPLEADLRGDGCPVPVVWDGEVLHARLVAGAAPRRYAIRTPDGDPSGGQMVLGDWDCDGIDSPALYRPTSGVVAYFATVPGPVGEAVDAQERDTRVRGGRARLVPAAGHRCDAVAVDPGA